MSVDWVVVGLDNGGTSNNGTILDSGGRFLLDRMAEVPSEVTLTDSPVPLRVPLTAQSFGGSGGNSIFSTVTASCTCASR